MNEKKGFLTVSELSEAIKKVIKSGFSETIYVTGEISNMKISKGNVYFTLKDDQASISVVMWNNVAKKVNFDAIMDGKKVNVIGSMSVFAKSGSYNLLAYKIELVGIGNLYNQYAKLKEYYESLGYFDENRKKKLPIMITKVGVITSVEGAALQDFLYVIKENDFHGEIYIKNAIVQGKDCPISVSTALEELDKMGFDVIVITRGGGSFEDLYGFSDKLVVEAIVKCKTCVISAIGHEVDYMLSDFVADIRAPTPSIAAGMIAQSKYDKDEIIHLIARINRASLSIVKTMQYELKIMFSCITSPDGIMDKYYTNMTELRNIVKNKVKEKWCAQIRILAGLDMKLSQFGKINYGYTINSHDEEKIETLEQFNQTMKQKKKLKIKFIDGDVTFQVRDIKWT